MCSSFLACQFHLIIIWCSVMYCLRNENEVVWSNLGMMVTKHFVVN